MKSHVRHSKASGSTKRRIFEIINRVGRYSLKRLEREQQKRNEMRMNHENKQQNESR